VVATDGSDDRPLVEADGDEVTWGQAEFVAAEEMERYRGYWWAPDGGSAARAAHRQRAGEGLAHRRPGQPRGATGRAPLSGRGHGQRRRQPLAHRTGRLPDAGHLGREAYEYLTRVSWTSHGDPVIQVMTRDQRRAQVLGVDVATGATTPLREQTDDVWVDLVSGVPVMAEGGRLVTCEDSEDTHRLVVDGQPVTPPGLQVAGVLGTDDDGVLLAVTQEPLEMHLAHAAWDGSRHLADRRAPPSARGPRPAGPR
jgi:dipeptidyl-peptidase-4